MKAVRRRCRYLWQRLIFTPATISASRMTDLISGLTFRDNGIGFESERAERIFSPL
jgi:hypothetical protein